MSILIEEKFCSTLNRLCNHLLCIFRIYTEFNACLHGCMNIFQNICYSTRCKSCCCSHLTLRNNHCESHLIKDVKNELLLFLTCIMTCNKSHTLKIVCPEPILSSILWKVTPAAIDTNICSGASLIMQST